MTDQPIEEIAALDESDENPDLMVGEEVEDDFVIDTSLFKELPETEDELHEEGDES